MSTLLRGLVLTVFFLTCASLAYAAPAVLVPDQFYAVRNPDRLHGPEHTDKHVTLAYHSPTRRIYFHGGDYGFYMPDGSYSQSSYSQHMWSLDLAARFADPTNRNAGWTHEHGFCAAPGEKMPKRPDYVGFTSIPDQNILVHVPGEEVPSTNSNCPGETGAFADDPQYLRHHIMAFSPVTRLWSDLSANAGIDFRGSSDSSPWISRYDATLKKIVRLEINNSNGTRIELLDMDRSSPGYLTWKKTDVNTFTWYGGAGPHNVPWTQDPTRHVLYVGQRYASQFVMVDYVNNTITDLGLLPGDKGVQSDNTYLSFDWNARQLVYVERRNPGGNPLGGSDIAGRVWRYNVDTKGPWVEITHLPIVSLGGEAIPSTPYDAKYIPYGSDDSIPHATSLVFDPDNNVTWFFGTKSEGTLYYADQFSYALRLTANSPPPPTTVPPPVIVPPPVVVPPPTTGPTAALVVTGNPATGLYAVEAQTTAPGSLVVKFFVDGVLFSREANPAYCLFAGDGPCNTGSLGKGVHVVKAQVFEQSGMTVLVETQMTVTEGVAPPASASKPTLGSMTPSPVFSGSAGFNLAVSGTGFASGLKATVGGQARTVTFGSATQATLAVLAADVVKVGNVAVQVTNPGACGAAGTAVLCDSNTMQLVVALPTQAPPPARQKISIQVTPPNCMDVSINGVPIPGTCASPLLP